MQLIVFNRLLSTINRRAEAACLRAAYLLGSRPILAGDTAKEIYYKRDWKSQPILHKLDMLITFYKNEEEFHTALLNVRKSMKTGKQKTREQIVAYRKMEQMVADCWETAITLLQDSIDVHGFGVIRELEDKQVFGYLITGLDLEKEDEDQITASNLMQLFVVDEHEPQTEGLYNTPELFFLGSGFWAEAYVKPPIYAATDAEAADVASIYLQHCFTLPPINTLTAAELHATRTLLQPAGGSAFCEAVDEWCHQCYNNELPASRISTFQKEVLPAAATLQAAIDSNPTLQLCRRQHSGHPPVEVWMGEMPVLRLWQYYKHFGVLNDNTWQKLQAQKDNPDYCEQRWPVMVLQMDNRFVPARPDDEAMGVKKYLSVD